MKKRFYSLLPIFLIGCNNVDKSLIIGEEQVQELRGYCYNISMQPVNTLNNNNEVVSVDCVYSYPMTVFIDKSRVLDNKNIDVKENEILRYPVSFLLKNPGETYYEDNYTGSLLLTPWAISQRISLCRENLQDYSIILTERVNGSSSQYQVNVFCIDEGNQYINSQNYF